MLVPLSWLSEYIDLSGIPLKELRHKMSSAGLSVDRQQIVGGGLEKIKIGEIKSQEKHPDSDYLWVCQVESAGQVHQIVTGASNVFVGAKIPLILCGEVLPDGTKIETTKLRGIDSNGMMCSEKELGLGDNHEGIMILDQECDVSVSFCEYMGLPDVVFDVEVTSNRGDCLSMVGIAREISALINKPLIMPATLIPDSESAQKYNIKANVLEKSKCLRFCAVAFDNFKIAQSPVWLRQRLVRAGVRPVNNLVDISNYVMLEIGQPTHAYDAKYIKDYSFKIRNAKDNDVLQTLDKKTVALNNEMLVIADGEKVLGLAGVMGGEGSKITDSTEALIMEIANFDPISIRKTGMKSNIRSEAIIRYERGIDPELVSLAASRINFLMVSVMGGGIVSNILDIYSTNLGHAEVTLTSRKLKTILGTFIKLEYAERVLNALGFKTVNTFGGDDEWSLKVAVPSFRNRDVSIEEDLIEEVTRIYGYENVKISTPVGNIPIGVTNKRLQVKKKILEVMMGNGYQEILTYSFNSKTQIEQSGYKIEQALELAQPLNEDQRYMRMSLLPNILWTVQKNLVLKEDLYLYELSSVYHKQLFQMLPDESVGLAFEPLYFSCVISLVEYNFDESYQKIYTMLGNLFDKLHIKHLSFSQKSEDIDSFKTSGMFHPGRCCVVKIAGETIGILGETHPKLVDDLNLKQPLFMFEIRTDVIVENTVLVSSYSHYSIYPATTEKMSFIFDINQNMGDVVLGLKNLSPLIADITLTKPYFEGLEKDKKAVTISFVYQSINGPVKDADTTFLRSEITQYISKMYKATLRA
ncbi:MAG: phenylalanine--tRNA ligase subunit beta [bacterium]|nr:phenylalanine--tRNA ligase subunit beta [bacterium]